MIFKEGEEIYVFEAVQPVKVTPFKEWIKRGEDSFYEVLRLKEEAKLLSHRAEFDALKKKWIGKNYDILFEWSNDELYCSELVWKVYKDIYGIELCPTKKMKDFDLSHPYVKTILKQRYGSNIPLEQEVVSPQDLYESSLLENIMK